MLDSPEKPSHAQYVHSLCDEMAKRDKTLKTHLKTKLPSGSLKYRQLIAWVRTRCNGQNASFSDSEPSEIYTICPADDESMIFESPPPQEHSSLSQTMMTTAGCNSSLVPESDVNPPTPGFLQTPCPDEEPQDAPLDTSVKDIQELFGTEEQVSQQKSEPNLAQSFINVDQSQSQLQL